MYSIEVVPNFEVSGEKKELFGNNLSERNATMAAVAAACEVNYASVAAATERVGGDGRPRAVLYIAVGDKKKGDASGKDESRKEKVS